MLGRGNRATDVSAGKRSCWKAQIGEKGNHVLRNAFASTHLTVNFGMCVMSGL